MKKILVPFDGSKASSNAASTAVTVARKFGADVTFMMVANIPSALGYTDTGMITTDEYMATYELMLNQQTELNKKLLDALVTKLDCDDLNTEKKTVIGTPYEEIIKEAEEGKYDLIVMGRRGMNPVKRFFLGSVSQRVIAAGPCPVLVVKE